VILFDAVPTGSYAGRQDLNPAPGELEAIIELSAEYQRRRGYPGIHCYAYSKSHRGIGCAGGVSQLYVGPKGEVCPCDFDPRSVGNVREAPLHVLWDRFAEQGWTSSALDGCRRQRRESRAPGTEAHSAAFSAKAERT
jgi:MoaA/NifB/PqqE/SkfB family radical SAM enzyme